MSEIKYLDTEALKYFNNKQKIFYDNRYILKNNVTLEEYNSTSDIQFVLTTDQIDGTSNIKGVNLLTHSVPMAKKADYAETAKNATTASYAESADNAATSDFASVAGSANNLTSSVKIYGQDFNGSAAVDGVLNINNSRQINNGGNLYNCSTPLIINSTQTTSKDSSGNTTVSGIGYVGAKLTTTKENKINNTTTVTGYGVYTDGDILYMWHQNNDKLYSNEDPGNASQILSIVKSNTITTTNFNFNQLNAGNTTAVFGETTVTGLHITNNTNIWWDSNNNQLVISGGDIKNSAITKLDSRITALENGSTGGSTETWVGTQTQYDAITIKDADTFYYITED